MNDSVNKKTVFLVDDEAINLACFSELLLAFGYEVRTATNGKFALQSIQKSPPDLVVLDIKLPGMNGYQIYHELQLDDETRAIPVIFMSGIDRTFEDKTKEFEINDCDYLLKPIDMTDFLTHIKKALKE